MGLEDFEFHDSEMHLVDYSQRKLILIVTHLNIRKGAEQNPFPYDMEIGSVRLTFDGFSVNSFEPGRAMNHTIDGTLYTFEHPTVFKGSAAEKRLIDELSYGITVYEFGVHDSGFYYMDAGGIEPWFTSQFSFDSVTIEWEEFIKKAYCER